MGVIIPIYYTFKEISMKNVFFSICVTLCVFMVTSCEKADILEIDPVKASSNITSISFQVGAKDNSPISRLNHELFTIVCSKEELDKFASERFYQYWTNDGGPYNVYYLKDLTEKYNEDFFNKNALILYLFGDGNTGGKFDITKIERNENILTIFSDFHSGDMTAISYWTVVIKVSKTDVNEITTLEIK